MSAFICSCHLVAFSLLNKHADERALLVKEKSTSAAAKTDERDPESWGVVLRYQDANKIWRDAPQEAVTSILDAMGADRPTPDVATEAEPVVVTRSNETLALDGDWRIETESGEHLDGRGDLTHNLPFGYHELFTEAAPDGQRLIVAPNACPSSDQLSAWGWAVQLYAMRSRKSWGIGDLGDLREFATVAKSFDADFAIVNPLHAMLPGFPQHDSPYYPSSREFRNPLFLRVEEVPGADLIGDQLNDIARAGNALNTDRKIDRDAVWRLKLQALEAIFEQSVMTKAFHDYVRVGGTSLRRFAEFCALYERFGGTWREWAPELRRPDSKAVADFAAGNQKRVMFHMWLQWLIDLQLAAAGDSIGLIQDLAIGVDPAGADAWIWQDALALNMRVGAPPDEFNTRGQDWGLPPFDPWKLRTERYEPFIGTLRSALAHASGLRIDHVMGLFRLYWIPEGNSARDGTYVRYRWDEMLSIIALESHRATAHVIGEDLGTVEPYMREELDRHNLLSYRLLWFENEPPKKFPRRALAAVTTHDLPTIAGLWSGWDIEQQRRLGTEPNEESTAEIVSRVAKWLGVEKTADARRVTALTHEMLASAPSAMVSATLDDALGVVERPNFPGTTTEWPNWSLALPVSLEEFGTDPGFVATSKALSKGRVRSDEGAAHDDSRSSQTQKNLPLA